MEKKKKKRTTILARELILSKHLVTAIQWEVFRWNQQISEMLLCMMTSSDKKLVKVTPTLNKQDYHAAISFK